MKWGRIGIMEQEKTNDEIKMLFEADLAAFAIRYDLERLRVESPNFIREYRRSEAGGFILVSEKAVVRAFGQSRRVSIGEGEDYLTYEAAQEGVRASLSEYYRSRRDSRSPAERKGEARRQKRYRERRKERETQLDRQQ